MGEDLEHDVVFPPFGMFPGVPPSHLVGGLGAVEAPASFHSGALGEPLGHLGPAVARDQTRLVVPGLGLALLVAEVVGKRVAGLGDGTGNFDKLVN